MEQGQVTIAPARGKLGVLLPRYGSREYYGYCGCRAD